MFLATFVVNEDGRMYRVTNVNQLSNGQAVWIKNQAMVFPDYYYEESFLRSQISTAGLHIDFIENYCTEEQRLHYNSSSKKTILDKTFTDNPPFQFYHLSKSS